MSLDFKQSIGANDALRTGTYAKTLTFTLSTTAVDDDLTVPTPP